VAVTSRQAIPRGHDLVAARRHLARVDPGLGRWMRQLGPIEPRWHEPFSPVDALARAIIYQQLSGKAAGTIMGRVLAAIGERGRVSPEALRDADPVLLRACGVSANKQAALKDLADKALSGVVPRAQELRWLDDAALIERLTAVRGIGRWTVEMMLIFRLGRPDVLPVDDLGVRKGAQRLLALPEAPKPKVLAAHGERWGPWRTLASLYLWKIADAAGPNDPQVKRSQSS
jgi:DNA-3-methyladenine glycosylase II